MNAYDVFIEPTVVTDCVACNFVSSTAKHLVVAKATLLEVYETVKTKRPNNGSDYKLRLLASFKLQGRVTDLKPIRTVENPALDYLLVSTKAAKVSCIRWDPLKHSIATVSLHYYEHALQSLAYESVHESRLVVGSPSRPVFCLRRGNLLVILPFHRLDEDDDEEGGSDAEDADMEDADSNSKTTEKEKEAESTDAKEDGPVASTNMPLFGSSYIVDVATLDESIGDVIDFQFLHNYRAPTVAILSQRKATWAGLLPREKDNITFTVWSMDVASASVTTILKLEGLPFDIDRIVPLRAPLNGSLLVGCNELIHVDSGGISRRIALNQYVADITASVKNYVDQSELNLMLEDCSITQLAGSAKALMVVKSGQMFFLDFDVDGKTIKKFSVEPIDPESYPGINVENPGPMAALAENLVFFGGKSNDSLLVELSYKSETEANGSESAPAKGELDEDEDDLYDDDDTVKEQVTKQGSVEFVKHDELVNNGPITSFTLGKYSPQKFIANLQNPSYNEVSVFAAGGVGKSGHVSIMTPTVQPIIKSSLRFSQINRLWIINNKYLITSDDPNSKSEIFDMSESYARLPAKHFVNEELTIAMHELGEGKFILQVTPKQIILFNNKFKKVVSLEEELKEFGDAYIVNSVFNDDFLMIFFSTGEVVIYSINTYNKTFTKVELPKLLSDTIITTGYITNSRCLNVISKDLSVLINRGQKRKRGEAAAAPQSSTFDINAPKSKTFVVVTGDNRIVVFSRFHNEKCFQLNSVDKFTDILSLGFFDINGADPDPFIKQVILNDLGDEHSKDEYLTILTIGGELHSYKMFYDGENYSFVKQVNLPITGAPFNAYPHGTSLERRMIYLPNVSGTTCIMVTGVVPYFITASRHSHVKVFKFSKIPIISFVPYSDEKIKNGLIYLDTKKNARIVELPDNFNYDNNWPIRRIPVGETVKSIAYHETSDTFVLSTFKEIEYGSIDEEGDLIVGTKKDKPQSTSFQGQIRLISPLSWTTIDSFPLEENEVGMQVKSLVLDVGSETKRFKSQKEFVLVGTGKYRTEDLGCNGAYKLIEIIDIIPEPGKPETNHKFKDFAHEDIRGAVTSVCDVSGRFLIAQGQKIIVRDIKDNSAVPVAFMDLSVYVSEAKSFGNLILFGDTLKSVSLAGFDAEPFRMILLGKDMHQFDVSSADFIFKDEEIFIIVADNDRMVHILQYNPEDPESANGQRLLLKSSFNTNYTTTSMKSIPKHEQLSTWVDPANTPFQTIASTTEGAMYTVFPTNEFTFRRMYILQQQLMEKEYHYCGLNPKSNRAGAINANPGQRLKPTLDCELLRRYAKLNQDRMKTLGSKISINNVGVDLWRDLIEFENVLNNL